MKPSDRKWRRQQYSIRRKCERCRAVVTGIVFKCPRCGGTTHPMRGDEEAAIKRATK